MERTFFGDYLGWASDLTHHLGLTSNVIAASITLLVGFTLALLARPFVRELVRRGAALLSGFGRFENVQSSRAVEHFVANTVYWAILIATGLGAIELLGVSVLRGWLSQLASYLPRVMAAMLILALGTLLARASRHLATRAARSANAPGAERVGQVVETAILLTSVLVAIDQVGIEISFIKTALLIVLAAMLFGAALAFGLGGRELVSNVLSAHYVQRAYQVGQTLRISGPEGIEGRIVRITEISVVIETSDGELAVPAAELTRSRSTLVLRGAP
jgi:small-conductance mechanosensitive channel